MPTGIDLAPGASWLLYLPAQLHVARSPSPPATRALLSRLVLETDERSRGSRSKTDEADAGLLWATSEHLRPADTRHLHAPRAPLQGGADDATGLLIAALAGPRYHTPIGRGNEDLGAASTCHAEAARAAAGERMQRPCRPEST